MRCCKFCRELLLSGFGPLSVNELKEIKTDPDTVDPYQLRDVLDMIDVMVERAFFFSRAHEDGVDADHPALFTNHLDLFITDVALDVVVLANVRVGHDWRLCCDRENLFKPCWIDVRKINNHTERLAFAHYLATKRGETLSSASRSLRKLRRAPPHWFARG